MTVSARGLFRATGKKPKEERPRSSFDFYPTPNEPIDAFVKAEREWGLYEGTPLWEPAAGDGCMAERLRHHGYPVLTSDIQAHQNINIKADFFNFNKPLAKHIITNPPFSECNWRDGKARWIHHALNVLSVRYMALLLPWTFPAAAGHACWWEDKPPDRVYLMRWKIDFTGQGAPPTNHGWFVWDKPADREDGASSLYMLDRPRGGTDE